MGVAFREVGVTTRRGGVVSRVLVVLLVYCLSMASTSGDSLADFPTKPHQPRSLVFPKRVFGSTKTVERSFQQNWFDKWPFLHYDEVKDSVFCHTCIMGFKLKRIKTSMRADPAFVSSMIINLEYY